MNYQPLRDQIIVRVQERDTSLDNGLVIIETSASVSRIPSKGIVLAVGPGKFDEKTGITTPLDIKIGDKVLFHVGSGIKLGGDSISDPTDNRIMRHEDVLAVLL